MPPSDVAPESVPFSQLGLAEPLLLVLNLDEAELARADDAVGLAGLESFMSGAATRAVPICASSANWLLANPLFCRSVSRGSSEE